MNEQFQKMDITTLHGGAVIERINVEMSKVFANIVDLNTDPDATREVVVKIKFKPTRNRLSASTAVSCSSKLCSMEKLEDYVYFSENGEAFERREPVLEGLFEAEEPATQIEPQAKAKKGLKIC